MLNKHDYLLTVESKYPDSNIVLRHLQYEKVLVSYTINNLHNLSNEQFKSFYLYSNYNDEIFLTEVDKDLYDIDNCYEVIVEDKKSKRKRKSTVKFNLIESFSLARVSTELLDECPSKCIELTALFCNQWRPLVWKKIESYLV
jgi:hypothetical protein